MAKARPGPLAVEPWLRQFPGVEGFLRAIAEEPWEDAHRLILADWLEERGATARAEFIRLHCREEAEPSALTPTERARLTQLNAAGWREWLSGLPPRVSLARGLACAFDLYGPPHEVLPALTAAAGATVIQTVVCSWEETTTAKLKACAKVCKPTALVTRVRYHPWLTRVLAAFARRPLALLASNSADIRPAEVARLIALPAVRVLRRLSLRDNTVGVEGALALASAPLVATLEQLNLAQNELTDAGVRAVAGAPWPRLRWLDLSFNQLTPRGLETVVNAPWAAGLVSLALRNNRLDASAVRVLFAAPDLRRLRRLALSGLPLTPEDLAQLRQRWPDLEVIP